MITIGFLADHLDTIPTLARWFRAQWPDYHADMSQEEMEQDFLSDASRDLLPIRPVAFESNELAGTIILREYGSETETALKPTEINLRKTAGKNTSKVLRDSTVIKRTLHLGDLSCFTSRYAIHQ